MAKRIADKELNDRNWDQEDEGEEAGTFSVASEEVLKTRPIKKAKRRNAGPEGETAGAFKGFKGFSLSSSGSTFSTGFGNGAGFKGLSGLSNGNGGTSTLPPFTALTSTAKSSTAFNGPAASQPASNTSSKQTNGSSTSNSREYSRQLTALNYSVRDWITKHVNDNPLCDLNPIFRDYERHLATIEQKYGSDSGSDCAPVAPVATISAATSLFSFSKDKESLAPPTSTHSATFNFGKKVDSSVLASLSSSGFSFTPLSSSNSVFNPSTSNTGSTFSFASNTTTTTANAEQTKENEGEEEESEEPPKPVITEVKEDDAFYSKKCKLFYKKDNEFKEKGVGTLHMKLVADGKAQLLVRADTNLGNILLNILVHASMPCSRMGKNNVMLVCVPNPPVDDKNPNIAVPLLIRVKTGEDADELLKIIQEKKQ